MTGKTHVLGGAALTAAAVMILEKAGTGMTPAMTLAAVATGAVSALLPDIDERNSIISRKLPFLSGLFAVNRYGRKLRSINPFLSKDERRKADNEARDAGHRGVTHYFITCFVVSILSLMAAFWFREYGVFSSALFGVAPGYLSHILLDLISGRIPVLAPFNRKSVGVCLFRTGSVVEKVFVRTALICFGVGGVVWG